MKKILFLIAITLLCLKAHSQINWNLLPVWTGIVEDSDYMMIVKTAGLNHTTKKIRIDTLRSYLVTGSGGVTAFTSLTDAPNSYSGQALKLVRVNSGATGLEFVTPATNPMTSKGDLIYSSDNSGTAARIPPNTTTTQKFLAMTGDGVDGALPTWVVGGGLTVNSTPITSGGAGRIVFQNSSNQFSETYKMQYNVTNGMTAIGNGTSSAAYSMTIMNSDSTQVWKWRNDGAIFRNGTIWTLPYNLSDRNVSFGYAGGQNLTTGSNNFFGGYFAGEHATTAVDMICIGDFAGNAQTTGGYNTFVGWHAGDHNTTGILSTIVGLQSGILNETGDKLTVFGAANYTGDPCNETIIVGSGNGHSGLKGTHNILIGNQNATTTLTTGADNILLGNRSTVDSSGRFFTFAVDAMAKSNNSIVFGGQTDAFLGMYLGAGQSNTAGNVHDFRLSTTSINRGISNQASKDFYLSTGKSTGTGKGGDIIFQVTPPASSDTTQNSYSTMVKIHGDGVGVDVSGTGALLLPRLTTTQRDALTPVKGMIIYNTTDDKFQGYDGAWTNLE